MGSQIGSFLGNNSPVNTSGGATITGGETVDNLTVTGNETVGGTLGVTGATTLTGTATVNNTVAINKSFTAGSGRNDVITLVDTTLNLAGDAYVTHSSIGNSAGTYNVWWGQQNTGSSPGFLNPEFIVAVQNAGTSGTGNVTTKFIVANNGVTLGSASTDAHTVNGAATVNGGFTASSTVNLGTFARVTGSNFTMTTQALANITGLTAACVANGVYQFTACLSINSSTAAGMQLGVQYSAAGATVEAQHTGQAAAGVLTDGRISALNTAGPVLCTNAGDGVAMITGILTVGANAGNLTIQALKVTSGTATVYINSYLDVKRIA